jgi:hypothetical protein
MRGGQLHLQNVPSISLKVLGRSCADQCTPVIERPTAPFLPQGWLLIERVNFEARRRAVMTLGTGDFRLRIIAIRSTLAQSFHSNTEFFRCNSLPCLRKSSLTRP